MTTTKNNGGLIASILFASILVSAALVYAGYNYSQTQANVPVDFDKQIEEGIEKYTKKIQDEEQLDKSAWLENIFSPLLLNAM